MGEVGTWVIVATLLLLSSWTQLGRSGCAAICPVLRGGCDSPSARGRLGALLAAVAEAPKAWTQTEKSISQLWRHKSRTEVYGKALPLGLQPSLWPHVGGNREGA